MDNNSLVSWLYVFGQETMTVFYRLRSVSRIVPCCCIGPFEVYILNMPYTKLLYKKTKHQTLLERVC